MLDPTTLGNEDYSIDIELPETVDEPRQDARSDRREAIAQARAIRRGAASKQKREKRQAAEAAKAVLAGADPEMVKPMQPKSSNPHAVRQEEGAFSWLKGMESADPAESAGDAQPVLQSHPAPERIEAEDLLPEEPKKQSSVDPDALVAQILAEARESRSPQRRNADADAIVADILAREQRATAPAEPEPVSEEPPVTVTEKVIVTVPISPEDDPLARALAAETAHHQEKQRAKAHAAEMEAAETSYREQTRAAMRAVHRMEQRADRAWNREASALAAEKKAPRSRKIAAVVNVVLCTVLLFAVAVGMVVLERPTISESENRTLATMPAFSPQGYVSGDFTSGVAEYYNDTIPYREFFKRVTQTIRQYFGLQGDAKIHITAPVVAEETTAATAQTTTFPQQTSSPDWQVTTTAATTATAAKPPEEEHDEGELSRNILIYEKRGIQLYGGSYANGNRYADYLNQYKQRLGANVNVYSMVIPTACSYYTPEKFRHLIGSEQGNIENINKHLIDVIPVDVYSALLPHTDEPIYMRTDHHWGAMGAFYAAEQLSAAARVPFAPISEYEKIVKPGYVGTLYGFSGDITLKNNPEDFLYFVPKAQYKTTYYNTSAQSPHMGNLLMKLDNVKPVSWYLVYMGGDDRVTHVQTEVKNGRTLAIIKDSYGNAIVPWMTSSFENIYVIDMRYFKPNIIKYLQSVNVTDVAFAMSSFSATGGNAKKLGTMLTQ